MESQEQKGEEDRDEGSKEKEPGHTARLNDDPSQFEIILLLTHIGLDLLARGEADGIGHGREGVLAFGRDLLLDVVRPDGIGGARGPFRQARVRVPVGQTPIRTPGAEALRAQEVRFSDEGSSRGLCELKAGGGNVMQASAGARRDDSKV
jgi:hypothetical protein